MHEEPLITIRRDGRRYVRASTAEFVGSRIDRSAGPEACWPWVSHRNEKGYGVLKSRVRRDSTGSHMAHRISYEIANGPIPDGLMILHRCDNPPCCNPNHLYAGTAAENTADMISKDRGVAPAGLANGKAKISDEQVREIHALRASGLLLREIATRMGVSDHHIGQIIRGKRRAGVLLLDDEGGREFYAGEVPA